MPKRVLDEGDKPFEFRTGVAGLPAFGGMYRAGDPATIPPHKFHLLINVRIEPKGLIERHGLVVEHDTGVEECIDGLTGFDEPGASMLLWPGADPSAGNERNGATFRMIRPRNAANYSEFIFITKAAPADTEGVKTSTLQPPYGETGAPYWQTEPFFYRGDLCVFAEMDGGFAIWALTLPKMLGEQANNCQRLTTWGSPCPATPNQMGALWPRGRAIGSQGLLTQLPPAYLATNWLIESWLTTGERDDDALSGDAVVSDFLYVLLRSRLGDGVRVLLRYTGVTWLLERTVTVDAVTPDDNAALAPGPYGPIVSGRDFTDYRTAAGTWSTGSGVVPNSNNARAIHPRGTTVNGMPAVIVYDAWNVSATTFRGIRARLFDVATGAYSTDFVAIYGGEGFDINNAVLAWAQSGAALYAVGGDGAGGPCKVGSSFWEIHGGGGGETCFNIETELWLREIGGTIFMGGELVDYDYLAQAADPGVTRHGVWDITIDPSAEFDPLPSGHEAVYEVLDTEQTDDQESERYSLGALPAYPVQGEDV